MAANEITNFPAVIWMGSMPIGKAKRRYRLVHRGPARPNRPDDVPFALEQRIGQNMMKKLNWAKPTQGDGGQEEAIWALSHAFRTRSHDYAGILGAGTPAPLRTQHGSYRGQAV